MSDLTPDAACETYGAIKGMGEWISRSFVAYLRRRFPHRRDLLELAGTPGQKPRTSQELVSVSIEYGFLSVLRQKVERNALPPSGPVVSIDELYRCAGIVAAPFVADLENVGAVTPGSRMFAMRWRPRDLQLSEGAFLAGLDQVLVATGLSADLVEAVVPLVMATASTQTCLSFPSPEGPAEALMLKIWSHLVALQAKYACSTDELFKRDESAREFIFLTTNQAEFNQAIDVDLFTQGEESLDVVQEAAQATVTALSGPDFASAHADSAELELEMNSLRSTSRALAIAYSSFMHEEAALIWGKTSEPSA